jgi:general secretion pathway protein D
MAPTAITVGDAWKAYLTALNINGYTLVKSGSFYKIVQSRDIRYTPTKIYTGTYTPETENYVMRIITLKNVNSTEVTRSFRPFMSRYGRIIDIKQTNTIIVQDTGSNINRLVRLIKFIDVPGHEESLQIIKVQHSSAQEIAKLLDKILKGSSGGRARSGRSSRKKGENISKIIAEPRTNSIIAMANAEGANQLRELIKKLDVKLIASGGGKIHVYYLNHGDSETLAKTLSSLVSSTSRGGRSGSRFSRGGGTGTLFNEEVKITADKSNNAIVVTASPTDYLTIKTVIRKLDVARDQVYVEGMIMETQINKDKGFGVRIGGAYGSGNAQRYGLNSDGDLLGLLTTGITNLSGLFIGGGLGKTYTTTVNGTEVKINSVNALVTAIATDSNTNVLATPQILALDNTEAYFEVGESVPVAEKTNAANGSSSTSIKNQKVTLSLKITPQINKVTRFVKLKIEQKIEDFSGRSIASSGGYATTLRVANTTVVVRDLDTIAMGGLMRDKETTKTNKVPLLGDIPVIGWLFKNKERSLTKVNLLFFLTPKILSTYERKTAKTLKNLLNRRSIHLKGSLGKNDPFKKTVKGLYEKANKQEKGPLFDKEDGKQYRDSDLNQSKINSKKDFPNYKAIYQDVKKSKSAIKKNDLSAKGKIK